MNNWIVHFTTISPFHTLMRLSVVAQEERSSPAYHFCGRFRQGEAHGFFQHTLRGRGVYRDVAGEHQLLPGTGFLCRAANPDIEYYYPADTHEPWRFLWIAYYGEAALSLTDELVARYGPLYRISPDSPLLRQFIEYSSTCVSSSSELQYEATMKLELDAFSSARLVSDLLLGLGESALMERGISSNALLVKRAQRIIRAEISQGINVTELARGLDVSREHLTRVFHEEAGLSPYQYILRQRIVRACRLLKETKHPQKEIARMLGYNAVENFSRAFTRVMKLNPGDYRKFGAPPVE